ncbi:MAG: hypothetical protein WBW61_13520 [Rhodanobacteraceae bacterium]
MILRRVISHMKSQHWTGVVIELVIVVLGVFIGLQVDNWNQARSDVRLGHDYVRRLTRDLTENLAGVRAQAAYYAAVADSVRETDALLTKADPDPRMLIVHAYRASETIYTAPVRATWDQIVSSGHLGLLPRAAVESGLSQYYAFDVARSMYELGAVSDYRKRVRGIVPLDMQRAMRAGCSDVRDRRGNIMGFAKHCQFAADPADLEKVAAALRSDPTVAADLRDQYSYAASAMANVHGVEVTLEDALAALGAKPEPARHD